MWGWLFGEGGGTSPETTVVVASPRGKVYFRPQLFYQRVLPEHIVPLDCEIRLNMSEDGENWARLKVGAETQVPTDGEYARSCAVVVADTDSRGDEEAVTAMLRAASTWGDARRIRAILSSCYCTARCCSKALAEAAACGHDEAVEVLLGAGAPLFETTRNGKSPLHLACEAGHEAVARKLLQFASSARLGGAVTMMTDCDDAGCTAVELAVANELGTMARRLREYCEELQKECSAA